MLRVAFRYSPGRDAYVLRVAGDRRGPVLRPKSRRFERSQDLQRFYERVN